MVWTRWPIRNGGAVPHPIPLTRVSSLRVDVTSQFQPHRLVAAFGQFPSRYSLDPNPGVNDCSPVSTSLEHLAFEPRKLHYQPHNWAGVLVVGVAMRTFRPIHSRNFSAPNQSGLGAKPTRHTSR